MQKNENSLLTEEDLLKKLEQVTQYKLKSIEKLSVEKIQDKKIDEFDQQENKMEIKRGFAYGDEIEEIMMEKVMSNGQLMMQVKWKQREDGSTLQDSMLYESQIKQENIEKLVEYESKRMKELIQENSKLKQEIKIANQFKNAIDGTQKINNPFLKEPLQKQKKGKTEKNKLNSNQ